MTRDQRVAVCKENDALFSLYYFAHSKTYSFADFHMEIFWSFKQLMNLTIDELILLGFRECAKTALTKEFVIKCIVYGLEDYIVWDSFDGGNSGRAVFDIIVELQTNKRLKQDFGEHYTAKRSMEEITQKSADSFITNPEKNAEGEIVRKGIRVEAHTTQEPARGFNHGNKRPGLIILDDFETRKTLKSEAYTQSIWEHIQELKGGVESVGSKIIYLGNYITQFANIQKLIDKANLPDSDNIHLMIIPAIVDEKPTWPEKYVLTNLQAAEFAATYPNRRARVSLQKKKKDLWTADSGDLNWECEMMQNPIDNSLAVFKREYFKQIHLEDVLKKKVTCYVILDPALSEKDKTDDTGVAIIWTDEENNWYSKVFPLRLNSKDVVDFLFDIYQYLTTVGTPPKRIAFEKEKYYGAIFPFLKEEMKRRNIFLPMFAIEILGRNKEDRITNALQYRYETGVIYHVIGEMMGGKIPALMNLYEVQAQRFPIGGHDDMLDAHAYGADIVRYDPVETEEEKRAKKNPYNMDEFMERVQQDSMQRETERLEREDARIHGYAQERDELNEDYFDEIGG